MAPTSGFSTRSTVRLIAAYSSGERGHATASVGVPIDGDPVASGAANGIGRTGLQGAAACGGDYVNGAGEQLTGGKDDRVFRLDRVDDAGCAGMKP